MGRPVTDRDVKEFIGHMVLQMREAEMTIEQLRADNAAKDARVKELEAAGSLPQKSARGKR